MVATIGAIGTLLGGLGSVAGAFGRNNQQQQDKSGLALAQLQDTRNNEAYQQALSAMINRRSTAGFQDDFGSSLTYDPATNQWVSTLGALPKAEQTAATQANIARNTTDLRTSQLANEMAMRRATAAQPLYDQSVRNLENFRPQSADQLGALVTRQALTANNNTIRPMMADMLSQFARTGTAGNDAIAKLGRTSYENLRDALVTGKINALTQTANINNANLGGLQSQAQTAAGLSNPNLQFSGIQPSDQSKTMASLLADRARTASIAPAYGASGVNAATGAANTASAAAGGAVPNSNFGLDQGIDALKDVGSVLKDSNVQNTIAGLFGPTGPAKTISDFQKKNANNPDYFGVV